ncbi:MAG TPA: helix-turn-helix transcriptional regulator [Acidimicrobiales bacterium]|jgi:transcriptional regulator with XRE-family HTH domain|nr:helix-turn-helix transcriptional regulator [Acidimicrobiales bacterium]
MSPAGPADQRSKVDSAFGTVLRTLRAERGLSQEALGNASGNGRTYVGQLERGERGATLKTIFALSAVLEVDAAEIVRLVGERVIGEKR